jgi:hypothetical protein
MAKRTLKLPDGGHFELAIPEGFGAPIFALNDANQTKSQVGWWIAGVCLALSAAYAIHKAVKSR